MTFHTRYVSDFGKKAAVHRTEDVMCPWSSNECLAPTGEMCDSALTRRPNPLVLWSLDSARWAARTEGSSCYPDTKQHQHTYTHTHRGTHVLALTPARVYMDCSMPLMSLMLVLIIFGVRCLHGVYSHPRIHDKYLYPGLLHLIGAGACNSF